MAYKNASPFDISPNEVATLLARAGWSNRAGGNGHMVLSKRGEANITLPRVITRKAWNNIERSLGVQFEKIADKRSTGPKGHDTATWRKRFQLAGDMHRIGFPSGYITKHTGLWSLPRFHPGMVAAMGVDALMDVYLPSGKVIQRNELDIHSIPSVISLHNGTAGTVATATHAAPIAAPVTVIERPAPRLPRIDTVPDEPTADNMSALLDLMTELQADIKHTVTMAERRLQATRIRVAHLMDGVRAINTEAQAILDSLSDVTVA